MRKLRCFAAGTLALALAGTAARAQETPLFEVYSGYTYKGANFRLADCTCGFDLHGGSGSVAFNLNRWVGVVGDFGGYKVTGLPPGVDARVFTYMAGLRVADHTHERMRPFVQALFGGARRSGNAVFQGLPAAATENRFALTVGGGLDIIASPRVAIRLVQLEYLLTTFADGRDARQHNTRILTGVVFRFGRR